jgi:hypothetical protein
MPKNVFSNHQTSSRNFNIRINFELIRTGIVSRDSCDRVRRMKTPCTAESQKHPRDLEFSSGIFNFNCVLRKGGPTLRIRSSAFLTPGFGIRNGKNWDRHPGSCILKTKNNFWVKKTSDLFADPGSFIVFHIPYRILFLL